MAPTRDHRDLIFKGRPSYPWTNQKLNKQDLAILRQMEREIETDPNLKAALSSHMVRIDVTHRCFPQAIKDLIAIYARFKAELRKPKPAAPVVQRDIPKFDVEFTPTATAVSLAFAMDLPVQSTSPAAAPIFGTADTTAVQPDTLMSKAIGKHKGIPFGVGASQLVKECVVYSCNTGLDPTKKPK